MNSYEDCANDRKKQGPVVARAHASTIFLYLQFYSSILFPEKTLLTLLLVLKTLIFPKVFKATLADRACQQVLQTLLERAPHAVNSERIKDR